MQNAQENIEFLQLESQLQQDDLQQKRHNSKLVLVHNIPLFELEVDSHLLSTSDQISDIKIDSHHVPISGADLHADAEIHPALPKPIIRP